LRGLISRLTSERKELIKHLLEEYEIQKNDLFTTDSIEALWRIFEKMVRDPVAGQVYCIIDGLDACTDESLRRLIGRIKDFFLDEPALLDEEDVGDGRNSTTPRRSGQKISAGFKMMLVSREEPEWLVEQLSEFPRVQFGGGAKKEGKAAASSARPAKKAPTLADIAAKVIRKQTLNKTDNPSTSAASAVPTGAGSTQPASAQHVLRLTAGTTTNPSQCPTGQETATADPAPPYTPSQSLISSSTHGTAVSTSTYPNPTSNDTSAVALYQPLPTPEKRPVSTISALGQVSVPTVSSTVGFLPASTTPLLLETQYTEEPAGLAEDAGPSDWKGSSQDEEEHEDSEHVDEDCDNPALRLYIEAKIEELAQERQYATEIQSFMCAALEYRGDGTFLWVDLAIEELKKVQLNTLEDSVNSLPTGLDEMYMRILLGIPPNMADIVAGLLRWTVCARRPMDILELSIALNLSHHGMAEAMAHVTNAVATCGNMFEIGEEDKTVNIVHSSLVDFLTGDSTYLLSDPRLARFRILRPQVDSDIGNFCITYLEQGCFNQSSICKFESEVEYNQRILQFPFLPYAASFWPDHMREAGNPYLNLSSAFFASKSEIRKHWWHTYWAFSTGKGRYLAPRNFNLLHLASYLDLVPIVHQMSQRGELIARLNENDSHGNTPLGYAVIRGNTAMFTCLLQYGAKQEALGETLLELACRKGQRDVVELLLNMGYDVNVRTKQMNAVTSMYSVTRWLPGVFNEGVEMTRDGWSMMFRDVGTQETPLHQAASYGHRSVMELLIQRGAVIDAGTTKGFTPLHSASYTGQTECVQLLIDYKANIKALTTEHWLPMHYAAMRGKRAVVELFLDTGVPVDSMNIKSKTALHYAAYGGYAEVVTSIVARGANIEMRSHKGETPLHLATRHTKPQIVELLLSLGANRAAVNNEGKTPLEWAQASTLVAAKECLRILQTYGQEGYEPWKPPPTPNATAGATATATATSTTTAAGSNDTAETARRGSMAPPPNARTFGHTTLPRANTLQGFEANISVQIQPAQDNNPPSMPPAQPVNVSTFQAAPPPGFQRMQSDPGPNASSKFSYDGSANMNQYTGQQTGVAFGTVNLPSEAPPPYVANPAFAPAPEKSAAWTSQIGQTSSSSFNQQGAAQSGVSLPANSTLNSYAQPQVPINPAPTPSQPQQDQGLISMLSSFTMSATVTRTPAPESQAYELPGSSPPPTIVQPTPMPASTQTPSVQGYQSPLPIINQPYQPPATPNSQFQQPAAPYIQAPPSPLMSPFQPAATPVSPYQTPVSPMQPAQQPYQTPVSPMQPTQQPYPLQVTPVQQQQQPPPSPIVYTRGLSLDTSNYSQQQNQLLSPMTPAPQQQYQQPVQSAQFNGNSTASTYNPNQNYSAPNVMAPYNPNLGPSNYGVQQPGVVWQGNGYGPMNNGMMFSGPPTTPVLQKKKSFLGGLVGTRNVS
jgi:ankyrin repeat protein